jgi:hypothetical protein
MRRQLLRKWRVLFCGLRHLRGEGRRVPSHRLRSDALSRAPLAALALAGWWGCQRGAPPPEVEARDQPNRAADVVPGSPAPADGASSPTTVDAGSPRPVERAPSCDDVRCEPGSHCELVQVVCIRAPCYPVPQCKPDVQAVQPAGVSCGPNVCAPGQSCCNASCGICTDPGKGCIKKLCPPPEAPR